MSYGCNGRPPLKDSMLVKNGYWQEPSPNGYSWMRRIAVKQIEVRTSKHCQYSADNPTDEGCEGCPNKNQQPEPSC